MENTKPTRIAPIQHALVTGASSGIGEEFARQLAARGYSLLLTARSEEKLATLRSQLQALHPALQIRSLSADLSQPGAAASLISRIHAEGIDIDVLINNAGFGTFGEFSGLPLHREREMIDLHIVALVELAHLCLGPMRARGRGAILNIASTAAFLPIPYFTTYAATKAFVLSFSSGLYGENRGLGVHVMAVCPGATQTQFFATANMQAIGSGMRMQTPRQVVATALRAWDRRKPVVVSGLVNRLGSALGRFVPRTLFLSAAGMAMGKAWRKQRANQ